MSELATQNFYKELVVRIARLRKGLHWLRVQEGFLLTTTLALGLVLLVLILEALVHFSSAGRLFLFLFVILAGSGLILGLIFKPLFLLVLRKKNPTDEQLALVIGQQRPEIKDRLANGLQIYSHQNASQEGYSTELVDAALGQIYHAVADFDFTSSLDLNRLKKFGRNLGLITLTGLLFLTLFFTQFKAAGARLIHPYKNFSAEKPLIFQVQPGNTKIIRGQSVEITARITSDEYFSEASLWMKNLVTQQSKAWFLQANSTGEFRYLLENVNDSMEYAIKLKDQTSPVYKISVVELPLVRTIQIGLNFPSYTELAPRQLDENIGEISALKGTRVAITVQANKSLDSARIFFTERKPIALTVQENQATGSFVLEKSDQYFIQVVDQEHQPNENPITYKIDVLPDLYPLVKITAPAEDVDITAEMRLILLAEAEDDFGFSAVKLVPQVFRKGAATNEAPRQVEIPVPNLRNAQIAFDYDWDLGPLKLKPSDWVQYYLEIFDNDVVSGPKSSRSQTYSLRFPSLNEMYQEVTTQQEQTDESLDQVYEQSKELKQQVDEIVEELKKDPKVSWEEKKNIEEALDSQKKLVDNLQKLEQELDQLVERSEKNDLMSLETLKKYQELQELFQELAPPELKKAMEELNRALENIDPEQLQQAMQKMQMNQESLLKNLERTISLLKRLQIEQRLDELIKKAEDLIQREQELAEKAESASKDQAEQLAEEQSEIKNDENTLEQKLGELAERMSDFSDMPQAELQTARSSLQQKNVSKQMDAAQQQLQQGNFQAAGDQSEQIQQDLNDLMSQLQQIKQQMSQAQKQQVMEAFRRSTHELLKLSKSQEEQMGLAEKLRTNNPKFNELAEQQLNLMQGLARTAEDLLALAQKTFFVTPEIGKALGKSMNQMKDALEALEGRNGARAGKSQGQAMAGLNEAVQQLRNSMKNLSGASSAAGLEQFMQQMQAMAGKQQGLNLQTQELGQSGKLTLEQQAALGRLAAEQRLLQKSLEQLMQEAGSRGETVGRLDEVAREMGEVALDLSQQNTVNPKTIQQQRRILSRLLDAQRSMRTQDYSRKREAETAKFYLPRNAGELPADLGEAQRKAQADLLKALNEGYARDYKELIKKYFETMSREMVKENAK
ncbi:hypothetical protein L0128_01935 [candidate division KSB1 bacterium]|nr:hypothetical protein [candidate division KSB1 bacterium]